MSATASSSPTRPYRLRRRQSRSEHAITGFRRPLVDRAPGRPVDERSGDASDPRVRILGPIEIAAASGSLPLGGPRQIRLLACLVLHANRAVSSDQLIELVWDDPAAITRKRLQMAIVRLRQALVPIRADGGLELHTVQGGYRLALDPDDLDAARFCRLARDGQAALTTGEPGRAQRLLVSALDLWRGPMLAEVSYEAFAQSEIRRLEELRLVALEGRFEADLRLGRHFEIVDGLTAHHQDHPTREHAAGQLMLTLYRCGRQVDALEVYQRVRAHLASELGLDPGPALAGLQCRILNHDAQLRRRA